jgi:ankyrin repeat protein
MAANANETRNMQFYAAVHADDITTVSRLIAEGANIEYVDQSHLYRDANGQVLAGQFHNTKTALGVAAMRGNINMARVLLDAGAEVTRSQLAFVVRQGNLEFTRLLLARKPEFAIGSFLVHDATESGNNDLVRLLLDNGAVQNNGGNGSNA